MQDKSVLLSKFLSSVLRHKPETIGLIMDQDGWVEITQLLNAAKKSPRGRGLNQQVLLEIVANCDKQRFSISTDGLRIRAAQGHSLKDIRIEYSPITPPDVLYHGTASRFLEAIMAQGLLPQNRQYVHLSADLATASKVGQRHGKLVILQLDTLKMQADGIKFYCAENGVWLCDAVPAQYLRLLPA